MLGVIASFLFRIVERTHFGFLEIQNPVSPQACPRTTFN